jgi:hypothetical protein
VPRSRPGKYRAADASAGASLRKRHLAGQQIKNISAKTEHKDGKAQLRANVEQSGVALLFLMVVFGTIACSHLYLSDDFAHTSLPGKICNRTRSGRVPPSGLFTLLAFQQAIDFLQPGIAILGDEFFLDFRTHFVTERLDVDLIDLHALGFHVGNEPGFVFIGEFPLGHGTGMCRFQQDFLMTFDMALNFSRFATRIKGP